MVAVPLAFGRIPLTLMAAAFLLLQLCLPLTVVVVAAEKVVLHDIQVAQKQFHQEQLQQLQRSSSSSSSSSSSTQLLSATIKTQLFRVTSTIKPYQRTLLANALHIFFEHVFDDSRQDVYKLDITHVAIYEAKLLVKATTASASDGYGNRTLVLNSLQASQFHIQQARSGGGAGVEVAANNKDDDENNVVDDEYDDEYYDDTSEFKNNNDYKEETESKEGEVATSSQTIKSDNDSNSSSDYVLSFATFVSAKDSTQPQSSLSQDGEFQSMLIHICRKFSSHLVDFVQSIDDDYFADVTHVMVTGYDDDEQKEKEEEVEKISLESTMVPPSSGSRLNAISIFAILLSSVALVLAVVKVRRRIQRRNVNRWRCQEISSSNAKNASSSIKSLQILYNKPTTDNYYDDDYSFDPLGTNTGYNNDNDDRIPSWSSRFDGDLISKEKFSPREEHISSSNGNHVYHQASKKINITLEEHQHVYAPPGKVGVAIDVIDGNPVVHKIKRGSPLEGLLQPKDIVIAIDDVDTTCMSAADVTQLMVKRMKFDRKITFVRRK